MQVTSTICDICFDDGISGSQGNTVDLSWLRPGYEVDICDQHLAVLQEAREKLAGEWLKSARRTVAARTPSKPPVGSSSTSVPGFGVEGVDWRWSKGRTRRLKIIDQVCPECQRSFDTKGSYSQHVRSHDPSHRTKLLQQLGQTDSEAPGGQNVVANTV